MTIVINLIMNFIAVYGIAYLLLSFADNVAGLFVDELEENDE